MALTRDFKQTLVERMQRDPLFARAMFDEALTLLLVGEPDTARLMLRELINSTMGFEALSRTTEKPAKSLHRMLSADGNPNMNNLSAVIRALGEHLHLSPAITSMPLPGAYSAAADHKQAIRQRLRAKHAYSQALFALRQPPAVKRRARSAA